MFWIRLGYIVSTIILILLIIAWILIMTTIYEMYLEEKIKEDRKYDINHKTIKDLKVKKKMKIIDIINKIANGEEVPEIIKYDTKEMKYDHNKQDYLGYYSNGNGEWLFQYLFDKCRNTEHFINDEVKILEEKKIPEKLDIYWELQKLIKDNNIDEHNLHKLLTKIELKQNEIIDYLDYLKNKGDE